MNILQKETTHFTTLCQLCDALKLDETVKNRLLTKFPWLEKAVKGDEMVQVDMERDVGWRWGMFRYTCLFVNDMDAELSGWDRWGGTEKIRQLKLDAEKDRDEWDESYLKYVGIVSIALYDVD